MTESEIGLIQTRSKEGISTRAYVPNSDIIVGATEGVQIVDVLGIVHEQGSQHADFFVRRTAIFGDNTHGWKNVPNSLSGGPEVHRTLHIDSIKPVENLI